MTSVVPEVPQYQQGFIEDCISNVGTNAPEAQSLLAPRFSVGKRVFDKFVTESRRDGAGTFLMQESTAPEGLQQPHSEPFLKYALAS